MAKRCNAYGALAAIVVLLGASHASAGQFTVEGTGDPRRNVLLIIADDVGVAQFSRYVNYFNAPPSTADDMSGVTPASTPSIDDLAAAGVTFLNAWSSPLCSAARAGIFTGLYSVRNGVYGALGPDEAGLGLSKKTIAGCGPSGAV